MYKRKDGNYETTKKIDGKTVHFYGRTQREVYRKIDEYLEQKDRIPLFEEVAKAWRIDHDSRVSDRTAKAYTPIYNRALARFGGEEITAITPQDINSFLILQGQTYAKKTVANQCSVLSMIFDYAIVNMGIKMPNPCDRIKLSDKLRESTREPLTEEQRREIERTGADEFQLAFIILYTGCRMGEALALKRESVDFEKGVVHITEAVHFYGNESRVGSLKTKNSKRDVPLLPQLRARLEELDISKGHYIIGGEEPITQSMLASRWLKFCRDHGMAHQEEWKNHRLVWKPDIDRHQIRHEYCTICYEAGIDEYTCSRLMGHADIQTTTKIYQHFRERSLKTAAEKLSSFLQ